MRNKEVLRETSSKFRAISIEWKDTALSKINYTSFFILSLLFFRLFFSFSLLERLKSKRSDQNIMRCRIILAWVSGLIWSEVKQLWDVGLEEYVNDMWNVIDFITNSLYVATVALRVVAYYRVQKENEGQAPGSLIELQREQWDTWDPMLISEGLFSAANIFR